MSFFEVIETVGKTIDGVGVAVIAVGALISAAGVIPRLKTGSAYRVFREQLGRSILLGLEFLVAADIIRTVAVTPDARSVAVLGGIVLIRTFLSFSLQLEVTGYWPWQNARQRAGRRRGNRDGTPAVSKETRRARRRRIFDAIRKTPPEPLAPPDSHQQADIAAMLREIGIALVEVEQPTQLVQARLSEIAAQYTTKPVRIVVLPTVLVIQLGTEGYEVDTTTTYSLQLDMAGRIDDIATLASVGAITPADAIEAIKAARNLRPRFGPVATTIGYAVTTVGFGMVINPTWASLPGYLFLGLIVGGIAQLGRPFPTLNTVLPTLAAMLVTILATWFVADTANDGLLRVIAPPLVATLPGMALTIGAMELASSQIISGASRLVYGIAQLAMLVFGVALGVHVAGEVLPQTPSTQMGAWSLYVAIAVVAVGLYVYLSAPRGSLIWLTLAIAVALVGQAVAAKVRRGSVFGVHRRVPVRAVRHAGGADQDLTLGGRDDVGRLLVPGAGRAELRVGDPGRHGRQRRGGQPRGDGRSDPLHRPRHRRRVERLPHQSTADCRGRRDWPNRTWGSFTGVDDLTAVADWMSGQGLGEGPISDVSEIVGGTQNIMLRFRRSGRDYVFRRGPRHLRPVSNKVILRETRVLAALADSDVPHPHLIAACEDTAVLGDAVFYLMEPVDGFNAGSALPALHAGDGGDPARDGAVDGRRRGPPRCRRSRRGRAGGLRQGRRIPGTPSAAVAFGARVLPRLRQLSGPADRRRRVGGHLAAA